LIVPMVRTGQLHWLASVVAETGRECAELAEVDSTAPLAEIWSAICRICKIGEAELAEIVAKHFDLPLAVLGRADSRALRLIPEKVARRFGVFPLHEDDRTLTIATSDPRDLEMEEAARFASGRQPLFEVATPGDILESIEASYAPGLMIESLLDGLEGSRADGVRVVDPHGPEAVEARELESGPVVKLTNLILHHAAKDGASDVHLEPTQHGGVVRFRIDGVLRPHMKMPGQALARVVSRIKIMSKLDITDRLRPQDGRTRVMVDERVYDLRISTVPTRESEKAVIRLLDPKSTRGLKDLSFPGGELDRIHHLLGHRHGIVLVTGPTGSGKTTTIYAAITELARGEINVMSVEDPVEYELPGATQIQVEPRQGVTFASALRAILRQDPDVIFVGEIRDRETAEIAVQASMTGHLVLATLHTNDAVGVIPRLLDIGLDAPTISATLRGALGQRLLRRVCEHCSLSISTDWTDEERRLTDLYGLRPHARAVGCNSCGHTGYRGRLAVVEVLLTTPKLQELIFLGAGTAHLEHAAVVGGMRHMLEVALEKVAAGETTLQEVERVLGEVRAETTTIARPSRVLIVDDDPLNRIVVRNLLENNGFRTSEAADGVAALEQLRQPDDVALIVLDLEMPRMGGEQLLAELKSSVATAGIPVIVLTGSEDKGAEARLIDRGAEDYLEKPIVASRFLARVKATLRRASA